MARGGGTARRVLARGRAWVSGFTAPETPNGKRVALAALVLLSGLALVLNITVGPAGFPVSTVVVPLVFGGLLLAPLPLLVVIAAVFTVIGLENAGLGDNTVHPGAYVVMGIVAAIALQQSIDRQRLGLSAGRGELMLIELRDRLRRQAELPSLPPGWHAEVEQHWAGGASFGGDFIVSAMTDGGASIEVALVDVSGKGIQAGTRALMLSGALGGLIGAVPPQEFLRAANDYLLQQDWGEGFATATHLTIDVQTGGFRLSNAGHPPAVHYLGGQGRWELVEPQGTVLGLLPDADFGSVTGELRPHDAILLYTDGLVEIPGRDLSEGIDKLLGAAERLIPSGFEGSALRLLRDVAPAASDDRAIVMLWRAGS